MNKSTIREITFKLLYSIEIQKETNIEEQVDLYIESNNIEDKNAKEYIKDVNHLFVYHGRKICDSRKPKCDICPINYLCSKNI